MAGNRERQIRECRVTAFRLLFIKTDLMNIEEIKNKKIAVLLSGGVDSSVEI